MSNRSRTCSSGYISQDKMLRILMEKNKEITDLKAQLKNQTQDVFFGSFNEMRQSEKDKY